MRIRDFTLCLAPVLVSLVAPLSRADDVATRAEDILDRLDIPIEERERASPELEKLIDDEAPLRMRRTTNGDARAPRVFPMPDLMLDLSWRDRGPDRREWRALAMAEIRLPAGAGRALPPVPPPALAAALAQAAGPSPPRAEAPPDCLGDLQTEATALAQVEPARARSYLQRAARAAWLPELRLRVERRQGRNESLDLPAASSALSPLGLDTADDTRYEARATWDLSRIVFNPDELHAQAQALRMADVRRDLLATLNHMFFERRRISEALSSPDPAALADDNDLAKGDAPGRSLARLRERLLDLEADLEALTRGASRHCR